jgi:hypothetical protein
MGIEDPRNVKVSLIKEIIRNNIDEQNFFFNNYTGTLKNFPQVMNQ